MTASGSRHGAAESCGEYGNKFRSVTHFVECNVQVIKLKTGCKVIGAHGVNKTRIQNFHSKAAENGATYIHLRRIISFALQTHYTPEKGLQYPLDWRLCGPLGITGCCGEEKNISPSWVTKPDFSAIYPTPTNHND